MRAQLRLAVGVLMTAGGGCGLPDRPQPLEMMPRDAGDDLAVWVGPAVGSVGDASLVGEAASELDVVDVVDAFDLGPGDSAPNDAVVDAADASDTAVPDTDAADAGPYQAQAPHCARSSDAGAPRPPDAFDAGADGPPGVLALPQVTSSAGAVLAAATFVSVTFPGDPHADELDDFVAALGCTPYWRAVGADYGVGDAVAGRPVHLTEQAAAVLDDTNVRAWLAMKIDSGDPQFPRPPPGTVYTLWYPETSRITLQGAGSCDVFVGYHEAWHLADGTPFSYAVMPRCPSDAGTPLLEDLTSSASHELIEACTDPRPDTQPAYASTDPNHPGIAFGLGSEVGDLCEFGGSPTFQPQGFPWHVQRIWSNRSAWSDEDPCVPADSPNYDYAAPLAADTMVTSLVTGSSESVTVVHVPVGGTVTVGVRLVSNYAVGTMSASAYDVATLTGMTPNLQLSLAPAVGQPGDTLQLTIHKLRGDPLNGAEAFVLLSQPANAPASSYTAFWALTSD